MIFLARGPSTGWSPIPAEVTVSAHLLAAADELCKMRRVDIDIIFLHGEVDVLPDVVFLGLLRHILEGAVVRRVTVLYPDVRHQLLLVQTVRDSNQHHSTQ